MTIHPSRQRRTAPRAVIFLAPLLIIGLWIASQLSPQTTRAAGGRGVAGFVFDTQGEPVRGAEIRLMVNHANEPVAQSLSDETGAYLVVLPDNIEATTIQVEFERTHFESATWEPDSSELKTLLEPGSFVTHDITLTRRVTASFWVATGIFMLMLLLIATERLHNTLAALLGVTAIFSISLIGGALYPELHIFDFAEALRHVDFELIFLLLGMMIVIGVIEETGIFQWLAYQAYRLSRGKLWLLMIILMLITAVAAALLDNVTTMLLITPITLEIALALGVNPLTLILPALLAANVGGSSTLIGTPVNIMIGSYAKVGFNDFLQNLAPGIVLALVGLAVQMIFVYRRRFRAVPARLSPALIKRLKAGAQIRDVVKLRKSGVVFAGLLSLFIFGESLHVTPAVAAIIGATVMLLWVHQDIEQMMGVVDWTTLIFFIGLFIVVGAVQEVGLLAFIADAAQTLVSGNLLAALFIVVWATTILSGVVDNIPFAAAMLPVIRLLTRITPGADSKVLYYALAVGASLGGSGTLIGSSSNLVVAGITERAGYRISFREFLKVGLPATLTTTALGCIWLLIRFW